MEQKKEVIKLLNELFVNRKDCFARQFLQDGKKGFRCIKEELTLEIIEKHLDSTDFLGVYQLSNDELIWGCLDFDENTKEDFEKAIQIYEYLKKKGFHPCLEKSGGGDYKVHIWIFCHKTKAQFMKNFILKTCKEINIQPHEIFPKQNSVEQDGYGNLVKLPLGKNLSSNKMSYFLDGEYKELYILDDIVDKLNLHLNNLDIIPEIKDEDVEKTTSYSIISDPNEFDDFFNYVLNNQLPAGITVSAENRKEKIQGINSNILKNEAIWFVKKGYSLEKLEQEVKPIYQEHGWTFGDLKGWFNKALKGEINEICKGEIIEWCKSYFPELLKLIPKDSIFLLEKDLRYITNHLINFDLVEESVSLMGNEYISMKKQAYDLLISLACPKELKCIKVGKIETDLRIHPLIILPSGKGKLEFKEGIKRIYKYFSPEANIKEPRTIHYQNLIGKVLKRTGKDEFGKKKEEYIKKMGFLFSDLLIIEEAYELLTSKEKNDTDCRDALIVGLDIYGKNLIQKQNIDNLDIEEETISGFPHGNCLLFSQPLSFPEKFVTKGTLRRFSLNFRKFPEKTKLDNFAKRLLESDPNERAAIEFSIFMRKINNLRGKWELNKEAIDTFLLCHKALLDQGYSRGKKEQCYTNILEYPLQNLLLKMSAIRALSKLKVKIDKQDIEEAFIDIIERFVYELKFIDEKVTGTLDYGEAWGGATGKKQECLEWLYYKGAISKESSSIFISTLQKVIADKFDISPRRARDKYAEWKKEQLINDYQGLQESCVWLNFKPKMDMVDMVAMVDIKSSPKFLYQNIAKNLQKTSRTVESVSNKPLLYVKKGISDENNNYSLNVHHVHDVHHDHHQSSKGLFKCAFCQALTDDIKFRDGQQYCSNCADEFDKVTK